MPMLPLCSSGCVRGIAMASTVLNSLYSVCTPPSCVGNGIIPIIQMKKLRLRELPKLFHGSTTSKHWILHPHLITSQVYRKRVSLFQPRIRGFNLAEIIGRRLCLFSQSVNQQLVSEQMSNWSSVSQTSMDSFPHFTLRQEPSRLGLARLEKTLSLALWALTVQTPAKDDPRLTSQGLHCHIHRCLGTQRMAWLF